MIQTIEATSTATANTVTKMSQRSQPSDFFPERFSFASSLNCLAFELFIASSAFVCSSICSRFISAVSRLADERSAVSTASAKFRMAIDNFASSSNLTFLSSRSSRTLLAASAFVCTSAVQLGGLLLHLLVFLKCALHRAWPQLQVRLASPFWQVQIDFNTTRINFPQKSFY
jgi:hypothetical protein